MRKTNNKKLENGRWPADLIVEVLGYADVHTDARAIEKYSVPASTFYGWKRNPKYKAKRK